MGDLDKNRRRNRDGTSQGARLISSLAPESYLLDDRSLDDLINYAREYSKAIQYYNEENNPVGTWESFFHGNDDKSKPHYALYLAFLECYRHVQAQLNTITKRHLDLYLEKIIRMTPKAAIADKAYVTFELAKNQQHLKLSKGTLLQAGKDSLGKPLYYSTSTNKDIVLNKAVISEVRSAFVETIERLDHRVEKRIFSSSNSVPEDNSWFAFGTPQSHLKPRDRTLIDAPIGFALSSSLFYLQGGVRTIAVNISCKRDPNNTADVLKEEDKSEALVIQLTQEKGWSEPLPIDVNLSSTPQNVTLSFQVKLDGEYPPFVPNEELLQAEGWSSAFPLMKVYLNPDKPFSAFAFLRSLSIQDITVATKVEDFPNFVLQNDQGRIDFTKPFSPFGLTPKIGSSVYLGSKEIFSKPVTNLSIDLEWMDLPLLSFKDHYAAYSPKGGKGISSESFRISTSLLEKQNWKTLKEEVPLFKKQRNKENEGEEDQVAKNLTISMDLEDYVPPETNNLLDDLYRSDTTGGFIRLELTGPVQPMRAFGHGEFIGLNTEAILSRSTGGNLPIPNQPYTPTVKSAKLTYSAEVKVPYFGLDDTIRFFHLEPFGNKKPNFSKSPSLISDYDYQGYLFLGIKDLSPPQNLTILFQIADGTANPQEDTELVWSYLTEDGWQDFSPTQILSDSTERLQVSGIIEFEFPNDAIENSTLMPGGNYWLRGRVSNYQAVGQFISLHTQSTLVTFVDHENDPKHLSHPLPKERIDKLATKNPAVKKVHQPFSSWGGRVREEGNDFYIRTSERLRHKQRAVSVWDYERIILERFPSIYKVKCLTHTSKQFDQTPGHVTVVVVPKVLNRSGVNTLAPKTPGKTLFEIKKHLEKYVSDWVDIDVINPDYQEIQVNFEVGFVDGIDKGYYLKKLNRDIVEFLSPWITDSSKEIVFGGKIYKSAILDFVERKDYVDFITDFKFYFQDRSDGIGRMTLTGPKNIRFDKQIDFEVFSDSEVAEPRDGKSILISASDHVIRIADGVDELRGIGDMATEVELVVT